MLNKHTKTISIAGKDLVFETGKIARQANAAVMVRSGETILLTTACASTKAIRRSISSLFASIIKRSSPPQANRWEAFLNGKAALQRARSSRAV